MTRLIYRVLFRNFADQSDLFNRVATEDQLVTALAGNNFQACSNQSPSQTNNNNNNNCLPALFYDFFMLQPYSSEHARLLLLDRIKESWIIMNGRQSDQLFQERLKLQIYSVITYGPTNNGSLVYRVIYAVALAGDGEQLDPSDYCDPDDCAYSIPIPAVINSSNYSQFTMIAHRDIDGVNILYKHLSFFFLTNRYQIALKLNLKKLRLFLKNKKKLLSSYVQFKF